MKKILIVYSNFFSAANANAVCLKKLLPYFGDYDITLVTEKPFKDCKNDLANINIVEMEKYNKYDFLFTLSLKHKLTMLETRIKRIIYRKSADFRKIADAIISIDTKLDLSEYDLIISLSNPIEPHFIANYYSSKYSIPWIALYIDPYSTNQTNNPTLTDIRITIEKTMLKQASKVFILDSLYAEYINSSVIDKSQDVETFKIPGIFETQIDNSYISPFDKNKINFAYLGNLYWDIRNPIKLIEFFYKLDNSFTLYLIGSSYGDIKVEDKLKELGLIDNERIIQMAPVSFEDSCQLMLSSDVLVSIGNTVSSMVPSKIFDYISSKKPILHVYKTDDDPVLEILSHYPCAICIDENSLLRDYEYHLERINSLIRSIPKDFELSDYFEPYTASYVASKIVNAIEKYTKF